MKAENEEFLAILIIGGTMVFIAFLLCLSNESFKEWFSYFLSNIPNI